MHFARESFAAFGLCPQPLLARRCAVVKSSIQRDRAAAGGGVGVGQRLSTPPRWLPTIESSGSFSEEPRSQSLRELTRANGTKVQEKLIAFEPWNMSLSYTYIGGQPGASDYFPTMTVKDAGNGKSRVEWKARFRRLAYWTDDPPPGQDDATVLAAFNKVYPLGLETLKKLIEGR